MTRAQRPFLRHSSIFQHINHRFNSTNVSQTHTTHRKENLAKSTRKQIIAAHR